MRARPWSRRYWRQSAVQSTCCSHARIIWLLTPGLCGPVIMNRFGKPAIISPRYVRGPSSHFRLDRQSRIRADLDFLHGAGHGVEAGGEDDSVERVLGIGRAQPRRRDLLDRLASDVDQADVVAVIRLVVVGIEDEPLGADRVVVGA